MDTAFTQWVNAGAGHAVVLDTVMLLLTQYGAQAMVLLVVLQWWSVADRLQVRHICIAAGLSFMLGLGLNQVILLFVHRVRPYDAGVTHLIVSRSADWSFPSDHATATIAIAGAFLLHGRARRGFGFLAGAGLVSVSRVYVGTHYLSDVLGGAMTGLAAVATVRGLYRRGTRVDRLLTGIL